MGIPQDMFKRVSDNLHFWNVSKLQKSTISGVSPKQWSPNFVNA